MNITLAADADTVKRTREYARKHGTSINQLVRNFLKSLTAQEDRSRVADEFIQNATTHAGRSPKGYRFSREEAQRTGKRE
ncbi:MAG: DUF6364 family protein [Kiritimatiellae bacterium]|nr:DUF6364 family protein [Kiritimatiellia bacterium]